MAKHRMDVASFVGKLLQQDDVDALQEGVKILAQALMEAEVSGQIGADLYERSSERAAYRNGYRTRTWDTRLGTIELKISKITRGSYFPSLLEPRRRVEKALYAVVTEAYVKGVSTRKVDDPVKALGIDGISKSEVSRICRALDKDVSAFRSRPIEIETRTCGWTPPITRCARTSAATTSGSSRSPPWSQSASPQPGSAPSWASTAGRRRITSSGPTSYARSSSAASRVSSS
jgi:Transposase, Mutator family